jgi:hypothetical protein
VNNDSPPQGFWERLIEASNDVGLPWGFSDIGRELDIWPSAVQKWRDGINLPARTRLQILARNRGVNVDWLETGRGEKLSRGAMDAATRELLSIWTKLPADAQKRILGAAHYEQINAAPPTKPDKTDPIPPPEPKA